VLVKHLVNDIAEIAALFKNELRTGSIVQKAAAVIHGSRKLVEEVTQATRKTALNCFARNVMPTVSDSFCDTLA